MREATREQMARVEALALEHGRIEIHSLDEHGLLAVKVPNGYGYRSFKLDEDGEEITPPIDEVALRLPMDLVRRMLGDDVTQNAIDKSIMANYPDHAAGVMLQDDVTARIAELLATSERVRELARPEAVEG